jgi:hypothetical protein
LIPSLKKDLTIKIAVAIIAQFNNCTCNDYGLRIDSPAYALTHLGVDTC